MIFRALKSLLYFLNFQIIITWQFTKKIPIFAHYLSTKDLKNIIQMSVLSLTFHTTQNLLSEWENYIESDLQLMVENLMDVEKYILSEVQSDMINEGKNTNLLLVFDNEEKRDDFIEIELKNITERIESKFGENVMVFTTFLNPKKSRF